MFIAFLVELLIAKTRKWQKHNVQLANFDLASLGVIGFMGACCYARETQRQNNMRSAKSQCRKWVRVPDGFTIDGEA